MRSVLLSALATIVHGGFGSPSCPPNTTLMSSFNYSNSLAGISSPVLLHVCEDITRPDGAIYFMPAYQSLAISPFPLVLSKVTESNQPKNGDDNHYGGVLNYTKQEVLAAEVDIMGNAFLGLHGYPERPEPTLIEIRDAIPPLRTISGARVWTANRESGRDASFDAQASNNVAGSPSPILVQKVLPGASSPAFDREGILVGPGTQPLPVLVMGFPVGNDRHSNLTAVRRAELQQQLDIAVSKTDYATASQLQRELEEFSSMLLSKAKPPQSCVADTDCCYGLDIPSPGVSHSADTADDCRDACENMGTCVAWVFKQSSNECYLKDAFAPSQGHNTTWPSTGHCYGNRTSPRPVGGEMVFYEMAVVPVAAGTGYEQPVFVRFLQVNASAAKGDGPPGTLYFDTFAYVPSKCGSEWMAGCDASSNFFAAILDNYFVWNSTWEKEGIMTLDLPDARTDTDGELLTRQAVHALVLDMITRHGLEAWPRYGTLPGYDQPGIGADGFQEIFTATMAASLEWGLHGYARTVLSNWLTYFVRADGSVLYRGLEMAQQGRMLTMIAQYYAFTQDSALLLDHLERVGGIAKMLLQRRAQALAAYNRSDPRYGMPTGNDEADLFWTTETGKPGTELPFLSIATEMWRGLRDCAAALISVANRTGSASARALGTEMAAAAPALLRDIRASVSKDRTRQNGSVCHPYVAGGSECGMLPRAPSNRDSEPWRTYSEAMYSGALTNDTLLEILRWHQTQQGAGVRGSRLKLGVLSGCGGDVHCGDSLETFTVHGWGYGLLQADAIEAFLLNLYALSSHAYTRGTFIAPESTPIDRTHRSPSFATPAGLTAPLLLKWMLVWTHPISQELWLLRALPRVWLQQGQEVHVRNAPTAYGGITISTSSSFGSQQTIGVNLTLPMDWSANAKAEPRWRPPPGGIRVRLRVPDSNARMSGVTVGGRASYSFDADLETVIISADKLKSADSIAALQSIVVTFTKT